MTKRNFTPEEKEKNATYAKEWRSKNKERVDGYTKKRVLTPEQKARRAAYAKEWQAKNKEYLAKYRKEHYEKNREKVLKQVEEYDKRIPGRRSTNRSSPEWHKEYSKKRRIEVLDCLGGKCEKCGNDDWRVLQIDHIHGIGREKRLSPVQLKKDVLKHGRAKYQTLCSNCHAIKSWRAGYE